MDATIDVKEHAGKDGLVERYEGIILTTGFSPEPLILTTTALEPKYVHFICTEQSVKFLDRIVKECGLSAERWDKDIIKRADGADVYEKVKEAVRRWERKGMKGGKIAIDPTGGTKAMVSGSAVAGAFLNADLLYVDSTHPWVMGKPVPGSERITLLSNPFDIFGDLEEKKAVELFNRHNYEISIGEFGRLRGLTSDPRRFEVKQYLAEGYGAWDGFDFEEALSKLKLSLKKYEQYRISVEKIDEQVEKIKRHIEILKVLRKNTKKPMFELLRDEEFSFRLMVDVFCNSGRRAEQGRYDDAIIRFYRVLELIAQYRLAKRGINTSDVKIDDAEVTKEVTKEFEKYSEVLYGAKRGIADRIGLMDSWLLLYVLKDERIKNFSELKEIKDKIGIRNELLIEHQNQLGNKKKCDELEKFVRGWLKKIVDGLDKMCEEHGFISL